jgi:signal transduction histidine kinase
MRVLLCDTADEVTRLHHALLICDPALEIEVTTRSPRAVELAVRFQPDVVVTELSLEALGGAELVRRLREAAPAARVLAWTRLRDPGRMALVLAAGVSGYLLKEDGVEDAARAVISGWGTGVAFSRSAAALFGDELAEMLGRVHELEVELSDARSDVEQGTAAKGQFLANVSHELRTPVTVAKGIAHVLRNPRVADGERTELIGQLHASLDKLAAMVDEIIAVAELERGTLLIDPSLMDLGPVIRHAIDEVGGRYPQSTIELALPEVLPAHADALRITGVIEELLDNACRYSPDALPIEVKARRLDEGIVVSVTDHGLGMTRDVATRSFEQPFSTGEATLRKERAGAGVGLHLARQLVVRHGGILWTDPLPAGGTRVSFCLPSRAGRRFETRPGAA